MAPPPDLALLSVFVAVWLNSVGMMLVVPLLPFMAIEFGATSVSVGIMQSAFAFFQMVGTLVLGAASDRRGGRSILLLCLLGSVASLLAFSSAAALWQLMLFRGLSGFFGGTNSVCQSLIAGMTPEKDRTANMARLGAAFGLGLLLGPAIGGLLAPFGFRTVAFFGAVLSLANFILAAVYLPQDSLKTKQAPAVAALNGVGRKRSSAITAQGRKLVAILRREAGLGVLFLAEFLQAFIVGSLQGLLAIFYRDSYDYDASGMGRVYLLSGLSMFLSQTLLTRHAVEALGERRCVMLGHLLRLAGLMGLRSRSSLLAMPILFSCGAALIMPCMAAMASSAAPESQRGLVLGAMQSAASAGMLLGPIIAGTLYRRERWLPFQLCGAISCLSVLLARAMREPLPGDFDVGTAASADMGRQISL